MLILLSPAKSLAQNVQLPEYLKDWTAQAHQPRLSDHAARLVRELRPASPEDLMKLMGISHALAVLNQTRFQEWEKEGTRGSPALLTFTGDVYTGLCAETLSEQAIKRSQGCLRILSGLYGVLKPLDALQPYRLEMGTRLATAAGPNLYAYWGRQIADILLQDLEISPGEPFVLNLASNEYFKAVKPGLQSVRVVTPKFLDLKNGEYKMISFYAKKARGLMARHVLQETPDSVAGLESFTAEGYRFDPQRSLADAPVFTRAP